MNLSLKKKIIFSLIPTLLVFIFLEIALRSSGQFAPIRFRCYHPVLGSSYCPNIDGLVDLKFFKRNLKINSDGLIDQEYSINKPANTLRVAVLGDSFTAGEAIKIENQFPTHWEHLLSKKLRKKVEVINFGVAGTGTWQQLQIFHLKAKKYQPDLTVLVFLWTNDVEDNVHQLRGGKLNPLLDEYQADTFWQRIQEKRKNFNKWLWNHVALYQFVRTRYNDLENRIKYSFRPDYMKRIDEVAKPQSIADTASVPDTASVQDDFLFMDSEGWRLTKKLILKLRDEAQKIGSKLAVIQLAGFRLTRNQPLPVDEFDSFLAENNIENLNTFHHYKSIDDAELAEHFIPLDGHFNEKGHYEFARFSLEFLVKELSVSADQQK